MIPQTRVTPWMWTALGSCLLACVGDFAVTFYLGWVYPGYSWLRQSQSILGSSDSPVFLYMNIWEAVLCFLFLVFAYALRKSVFTKGRWQRLAVWLIVLYGLGEGIGSGVFPYDFAGGELTLSGKLHSLFSGLGEIAMVLLPFVLLPILPRQRYPRLYGLARFVGFSGPVLIIVFLLARQNIIPLRGMWQRLFILDYYSLLVVLAVTVVRYPFRADMARMAKVPVKTGKAGNE